MIRYVTEPLEAILEAGLCVYYSLLPGFLDDGDNSIKVAPTDFICLFNSGLSLYHRPRLLADIIPQL